MQKHAKLLLICLGCLFLQFELSAQNVPSKVINGKIVFSDTIKTKLDKVQIGDRLRAILSNQDYSEGGKLTDNNDSIHTFSLRMTDFLAIERRPLSIFSMMMRYFLILEYKDNCCIATIANISYIEPDEYEKKVRLKDNNFDLMPAEMVLLEKKYKSLFIKDASEKIILKTNQRVNEIFATVRSGIKR